MFLCDHVQTWTQKQLQVTYSICIFLWKTVLYVASFLHIPVLSHLEWIKSLTNFLKLFVIFYSLILHNPLSINSWCKHVKNQKLYKLFVSYYNLIKHMLRNVNEKEFDFLVFDSSRKRFFSFSSSGCTEV